MPCESEAAYRAWVADPPRFRQVWQELSVQHPERFPAAFGGGFRLHDTYQSRKQGLPLRRIKLIQTGEVFLVRPSLLVPYWSAKTDQIEKALYVRQWGVPFAALSGFQYHDNWLHNLLSAASMGGRRLCPRNPLALITS